MSEDNNVITLTDEDGNDMDFELISMVEMDDNRYAVLAPVEEEAGEDAMEVEVVVLKIVPDEDGEDTLITIEDDDEQERAFQLFLDQQDEDDGEDDGEDGDCCCGDDCCCGGEHCDC